MGRKKTIEKEPVTIRFKELANGNKSVYLDIYKDGKRTYEFLKLYIVPEAGRGKAEARRKVQGSSAGSQQRSDDLGPDTRILSARRQVAKRAP